MESSTFPMGRMMGRSLEFACCFFSSSFVRDCFGQREPSPACSTGRADMSLCAVPCSYYKLVAMVQQELDALFHCIYALHYHLVVVTKYRRKALTPAMLDRFAELARERVDAWGGRLIEVNGEADHVHLLFTLPPKYAVSDFVNALKTGTSRRLRSEFPEQVRQFYHQPVLWSRSYCVISCGGAPLAVIRQYIEQQERPEN